MKKIGTFIAGVFMLSLLLIPAALAQSGEKSEGKLEATQSRPSTPQSMQPGEKANKETETTTQQPMGQTEEKRGEESKSVVQPSTAQPEEKLEAKLTTQQPEELYANTLIGTSVTNPEGEKLGKIAELVVDPKEGRITDVVVSFGGFLSIGDKTVAIPWNDMTLSADSQTVIVAMGKEELENAPSWEKPAENPQPPMQQPLSGAPQPETPRPKTQ